MHDANVDVHLKLTYRNDIYVLHFDVHGTLTLLCDRCLDDLVIPVDTTYDINVEYGDEYNDDSDELLIIPNSDNYLNVSYMIYDTVVLSIPIKHVHPMGKCNRAMSALLKKHRAVAPSDEYDLADEAAEVIDQIDADNAPANDPRWDALKDFASGNND